MLGTFRSLVLVACLVGVVLGLATTALQSLGVTPILLAAEGYEVAGDLLGAAGHHAQAHEPGAGHGHHHGEAAWAPADGVERLFYSAVSNSLVGIGFAAVLLVLTSWLVERGRLRMTPRHGLMMGGLGFLAVFVAPSLGLPPEIPGATAAPLEARQWWWLATVTSAAIGLGVLTLARGGKRGLGAPLLLAPYAWVPGHEGPMFTHPDPQAVEALQQLHHAFLWASGLTNLAFWLLAGLLCAMVLGRLQASATPMPTTGEGR